MCLSSGCVSPIQYSQDPVALQIIGQLPIGWSTFAVLRNAKLGQHEQTDFLDIFDGVKHEEIAQPRHFGAETPKRQKPKRWEGVELSLEK